MVWRFLQKSIGDFYLFFCTKRKAKKLLLQLGKTNAAVSGDTRFDRVATILEKDNSLDFIEAFKNDTLTIVVGSSWPKDESLLVDYINQTSEKVKFIIAPHNIKSEQIQELKNSISKKAILFSEKRIKTWPISMFSSSTPSEFWPRFTAMPTLLMWAVVLEIRVFTTFWNRPLLASRLSSAPILAILQKPQPWSIWKAVFQFQIKTNFLMLFPI